MSQRDFYEVLGIERNASAEEIKRAYRRQAMKHHPDRNPGDEAAEESFKEAAEAYEALRDSDTRARYDRFGHAGLGGGQSAGFHDFDLTDALRAFMRDFGGFDDLFSGGGRGRRRRGPVRGTDVQMRMAVTLPEVATGVEKIVRARLLVGCEACAGKGSVSGEPATCPTCGGAGEVRRAQRSILGQFVSVQPCSRCGGEGTIVTDPCRECSGDGRVREDRRIKVRVPPGVETGNYLTLKGEGNAGPRGGPAGDLMIVIEVQPDERFVRHDRDVLVEWTLSVPEAALGANVVVPTLRGEAALEIPAGTQPGDVLRLAGQGVPDVGGGSPGDQLVQVHVWIPTRLSDEERRAIEEFAKSEHFAPPVGEKGFWSKVKETFTA